MRDAALNGGFGDELPRAVAINYAKLLAYKDEYEVARLYTDGRFEKQLRDQFDGDFKISFNLAPPMLAGKPDALGRPGKRAFGAWMMPVFRVLAKLRGLRGTAFDIFGYSADRRLERDLIAGYEKDVATVLVRAVAADARYRDRTAVAAGSHPRLRAGEGEVGTGTPRRATRNWPPISSTRRRRRGRSRRSRRCILGKLAAQPTSSINRCVCDVHSPSMPRSQKS